jgi:hypothetical protein
MLERAAQLDFDSEQPYNTVKIYIGISIEKDQ